MYKLAIVLRYLRKRKITIFPVAGVAIGVMALVVVLSIMEGFETDFRNRIRGISPDMTLEFMSFYGFTDRGRIDELTRRVEEIEEVRAVSPFISGIALADVKWLEEETADGANLGRLMAYTLPTTYVNFKGFDFASEQNVLGIEDYIRHKEDLFAGSDGPVFIIGARLAGRKSPGNRLDAALAGKGAGTLEADWGRIEPGAHARLMTFSPTDELVPLDGTVVNIVSSGIYELDAHILFMPIEYARTFRDLPPGSISGLGIALHEYDGDTVAAAKATIKTILDEVAPEAPHSIQSWEDSRRTLLTALAMERRIMAFILFFFLVVAGFSIAAILIMIVLEKVRDIGILRAMGASSRGIAAMFLAYGATIGLVGSALGLALGVTFVKKIDWIELSVYRLTGWQPFPAEVFDLPEIPRILNWHTNGYIMATAFSVSLLASLLPAWKASSLDPVEAIHYE